MFSIEKIIFYRNRTWTTTTKTTNTKSASILTIWKQTSSTTSWKRNSCKSLQRSVTFYLSSKIFWSIGTSSMMTIWRSMPLALWWVLCASLRRHVGRTSSCWWLFWDIPNFLLSRRISLLDSLICCSGFRRSLSRGSFMFLKGKDKRLLHIGRHLHPIISQFQIEGW